MAIKNLMENIISNTVNEVLKKEKNSDLKKIKKDDIIAYVLNRVPPKYITSERGLLHGKLDAKYKIQEKTDVLLMVYEAIDEILRGRESGIKDKASPMDENELHFSHVIGEVLEETTFSIVPGVEVSLLHGESLVSMYDAGWDNPYKTKKATNGYYHFWPEYSHESMGNSDKIPFTIRFKHPQCVNTEMAIELNLIKGPDLGKSYAVPIVLLKLKDGVDPDSL